MKGDRGYVMVEDATKGMIIFEPTDGEPYISTI